MELKMRERVFFFREEKEKTIFSFSFLSSSLVRSSSRMDDVEGDVHAQDLRSRRVGRSSRRRRGREGPPRSSSLPPLLAPAGGLRLLRSQPEVVAAGGGQLREGLLPLQLVGSREGTAAAALSIDSDHVAERAGEAVDG